MARAKITGYVILEGKGMGLQAQFNLRGIGGDGENLFKDMSSTSGRPSVVERVSQASPQTAGFGEDLFSCRLAESENQFLMLKGSEEGHVILIIDNDDGQGRA